ncbi:hypothetical protein LTR86_000104 [Recurvomyces mirabilis]|nr:hypothetical protein LTR86_000104 [Recurvomyces mirabilis]
MVNGEGVLRGTSAKAILINAVALKWMPPSHKAGRIGLPIVLELYKTGYQVTVMTRDTAHLTKVPSEIDIKQVDYDSNSSLTEALEGQDALVSTVAMSAISNQPRMIDAAIAADVKVFVPAEYTVNSRDALAQAQPMMSSVVDIQKYLATKEDQITWFVINCGALLELLLDHPVLLDFDNRKATLWDGVEGAISLSNFGLLARVVAAVLRSRARVRNHRLKVHGGTITQNRALEIAKHYSAQHWTAEQADSQAAYSASVKPLRDGPASTQSSSWESCYQRTTLQASDAGPAILSRHTPNPTTHGWMLQNLAPERSRKL